VTSNSSIQITSKPNATLNQNDAKKVEEQKKEEVQKPAPVVEKKLENKPEEKKPEQKSEEKKPD